MYTSLGVSSDLVIDTSPPQVVDVRAELADGSAATGDFGVGEELYIVVTFNLPVTVSPTSGEPAEQSRSLR